MNKEELIKYIKSPELLNQESLNYLNKLVNEFPYFQSAKLLLLKNLHNINSPTTEHELKQTAIHITNREKIYLLLQQPESGPKIKKEIKETLAAEPEKKLSTDKDKKESQDNFKAENKKEILSDIVSKRLNEIKKTQEESDSGISDQTASDKKDQPSKNFEHIADTILKKAAEHKTAKSQQKENATDQSFNANDKQKINLEEKNLLEDSTPSVLTIDKNEKKGEKTKDESYIKTSSNKNNLEKDNKNLLVLEYPEEELSTAHYDKSMNTLFSHRINILDLKLPFEVPFIFEDDTEEGDLIDKFIKNKPALERKEISEKKDHSDMSLKSIKDNEEYLTDTLVNIYIKQGYYSKAISAYKKLSLKYPEKSSYFAQQIKKIKDLINKT